MVCELARDEVLLIGERDETGAAARALEKRKIEVDETQVRRATLPALDEPSELELLDVRLGDLHGLVADAQGEAVAFDAHGHIAARYVEDDERMPVMLAHEVVVVEPTRLYGLSS